MASSVRIMSSVRPKASHASCNDGPGLLVWSFKTRGVTPGELRVNSRSKALFAGQQHVQPKHIGIQSHAERTPWIKTRASQLQKLDADIMKRNTEHSFPTTSEVEDTEIIHRKKSKQKTYVSEKSSADTEVLTEGVPDSTASFQRSFKNGMRSHSKTSAEHEHSSSRDGSSKQQKHLAANTNADSRHSHEATYYKYGLPSYWAKSSMQSNIAWHGEYPGDNNTLLPRAQAVAYPSSVVQVRSSHSSAYYWSRNTSQNVALTNKSRVWTKEKRVSREQAEGLEQQEVEDDAFVEKKSVCISTLHGPQSEKKQIETNSLGSTARGTDESEDWNIESFFEKLDMLPRRWEETWFGKNRKSFSKASRSKNHKTQDVEFTVMTYNILSQRLLEDHHTLYMSCSPSAIDWNLRRERLLAEISYHRPDIVNLQEVQSDHFNDYLFPAFEKLGYAGVYEKRKGDKCDGCATLWQRKKFHLLHSTPVDYCRGGLLDRNNIALLVELQPRRKVSKQAQQKREDKLLVANTHILFNPRRGDIKLAQLMVLLAEVDKHAFLGSKEAHTDSPQNSADGQKEQNQGEKGALYCPVIITGDFNMEPYCQLYKFLVTGRLQYQDQLIRTMSGQEEGQYGSNRILEQNFFSPDYGISDRCQYSVLQQQRAMHYPGSRYTHTCTPGCRCDECSSGSKSESCSNSLDGSMNSHCCTSFSQSLLDAKSASVPCNSGSLSHRLNLVSAHRHTVERLGHRVEEITTHHQKAKCTVDYIFYSVATKEVEDHYGDKVRLRQVKEGSLKLLARYGLMSATELERLGSLPNTTLASDHLCLIAKFLLT